MLRLLPVVVLTLALPVEAQTTLCARDSTSTAPLVAAVQVYEGGTPLAFDSTGTGGCVTFTNVAVAAEGEPDEESPVSLPYPNPASRSVSVDVSGAGPSSAVLYDVLGRRVTSGPTQVGPGTLRLSTDGLSPGLYVLRVRQGGATKATTVTLTGGRGGAPGAAASVTAAPPVVRRRPAAQMATVVVSGYVPQFVAVEGETVRVDLAPLPDEGGGGPEVFDVAEVQPELIGGLAGLQARTRYPEIARRAGIEGQVIVQFVVGEVGQVVDPVVLRSPSDLLSEAALAAVRASMFRPGQQRGRPVRVRFAVPVSFRLR